MKSSNKPRISLKELLEDDSFHPWILRLLDNLMIYMHYHSFNEKPIVLSTIDYKLVGSDEVYKVDLGVQLVEQKGLTSIIRIGTRVLGYDTVQEEVFAEIFNREIIQANLPNGKLTLLPLAQETYDKFIAAYRHNSIFSIDASNKVNIEVQAPVKKRSLHTKQ